MRFIIGAPCSGKGTIMHNFKDKFVSLSAGNLLRELCETPEYKHLKETLNQGGLVATDLICDILTKEAAKYNYDVFIDGFPRTEEQAIMITKFMKEKGIQCKGIFYIFAPTYLLIERTLTRTYCNECFYTDAEHKECCEVPMVRRADDNIQTLMKRLDIFNTQIMSVLQLMGGPIFMIDNSKSVDFTASQIKSFL